MRIHCRYNRVRYAASVRKSGNSNLVVSPNWYIKSGIFYRTKEDFHKGFNFIIKSIGL